MKSLENEVKTLQATIVELNKRLIALESASTRGEVNQAQDSQDGPSSVPKEADDDDDFDLFGTDEVNYQ